MCVRACVRACQCVCVCVCVRERERETDRQTDRHTECVCIFHIAMLELLLMSTLRVSFLLNCW